VVEIPLVLRRGLRSSDFEKKKHADLEVEEALEPECLLYRFETFRIEESRVLEADDNVV